MRANIRIIFFSIIVILFELFFYYLMKEISSVEPKIIIFDLKLFYSPILFFSNIALYTPFIDLYLFVFRISDMIFPFVYSYLLILLLRKFKSQHLLFPILALVLDLLENFILSFLIILNDSSLYYFVYLLNIVTPLKFLLIIISIIMIIMAVVKEKNNLKKIVR